MFVAWVEGEEVRIRRPDGSTWTHDSPYVRLAREHHASIQRRREWKAAGTGAQFQSAGGSGPPPPEGELEVRYLGLSSGREPGALLIVLRAGDLPAAVTVDLTADAPSSTERRIRHGSDFPISDLCPDPAGDGYVCAVGAGLGVHLGRLGPSGEAPRRITEGETTDGAPRAVPGRAAVLYHASGIGRDAQGHPVGRAPFELLRFDLERGEIEAVAADPAWDLTAPRGLDDGAVLALRRPYVGGTAPSPWTVFVDLVALPLRLAATLFGFLQLAALRYTGRLLTSHVDPATLPVFQPWQAPGASAGEGAAELVRIGPDGRVTVLQRGVLAYDALPDGTIVWSDGSAIRARAPGGADEVLGAAEAVRIVAVCASDAAPLAACGRGATE